MDKFTGKLYKRKNIRITYNPLLHQAHAFTPVGARHILQFLEII